MGRRKTERDDDVRRATEITRAAWVDYAGDRHPSVDKGRKAAITEEAFVRFLGLEGKEEESFRAACKNLRGS